MKHSSLVIFIVALTSHEAWASNEIPVAEKCLAALGSVGSDIISNAKVSKDRARARMARDWRGDEVSRSFQKLQDLVARFEAYLMDERPDSQEAAKQIAKSILDSVEISYRYSEKTREAISQLSALANEARAQSSEILPPEFLKSWIEAFDKLDEHYEKSTEYGKENRSAVAAIEKLRSHNETPTVISKEEFLESIDLIQNWLKLLDQYLQKEIGYNFANYVGFKAFIEASYAQRWTALVDHSYSEANMATSAPDAGFESIQSASKPDLWKSRLAAVLENAGWNKKEAARHMGRIANDAVTLTMIENYFQTNLLVQEAHYRAQAKSEILWTGVIEVSDMTMVVPVARFIAQNGWRQPLKAFKLFFKAVNAGSIAARVKQVTDMANVEEQVESMLSYLSDARTANDFFSAFAKSDNLDARKAWAAIRNFLAKDSIGNELPELKQAMADAEKERKGTPTSIQNRLISRSFVAAVAMDVILYAGYSIAQSYLHHNDRDDKKLKAKIAALHAKLDKNQAAQTRAPKVQATPTPN